MKLVIGVFIIMAIMALNSPSKLNTTSLSAAPIDFIVPVQFFRADRFLFFLKQSLAFLLGQKEICPH